MATFAPATWAAPTTFPSVTNKIDSETYAATNTGWYCGVRSSDGYKIRYIDNVNPGGTWSTGSTLTYLPAGYSQDSDGWGLPARWGGSDGTTVAFIVNSYTGTGPWDWKTVIHYNDNPPSGTWSHVEVAGIIAYGIKHVNGVWFLFGADGSSINGSGTHDGRASSYAYATSLTGTWTVKVVGTNAGENIQDIFWTGTHWLRIRWKPNASNLWAFNVEYDTDYTSNSWTSGIRLAVSESVSGSYYGGGEYANGYFVAGTDGWSPANGVIIYTNDYTSSGTWTYNTCGINTGYYTSNNPWVVHWDGTYWVIGGRDHTPWRYVLKYSTTLGGTFTQASATPWATDDQVRFATTANGYWIADHYGGGSPVVAYTNSEILIPGPDQVVLNTEEVSLGIFNPPTKPVVCQVDFSNMVAGDVCEVRCYVKTNGSGNTKKILYSDSFTGPQEAFTWQSVPVENDYYIEFTAVKPTGSAMIVDYFVQEVTV